jgi:hypothetical protein
LNYRTIKNCEVRVMCKLCTQSIVATGSQGQRNSPKIKTVLSYTQAESKKINILICARINKTVQNACEIRFIVCRCNAYEYIPHFCIN